MSDNEFTLPTPGKNERKTSDLLPRFFRTEANKKFLQATLDQLTQPGVVEKINSYYGRKNAKAYRAGDNYVEDVSTDRQNRQLEPAVVIKDDLDNVNFYKDYNDYINQLRAFGGNVENHSRVNTQETYAWNPNIDWDKFVNFREYYWAPNGPLEVPVRGQSKEVISTYTVRTVTDDDNVAYVFTPNGFTRNPTLKLYRGQTYRFEIDCPEHPIAFAVSRTFTPGSAVIVAGTEGIKAPGLFGVEYDNLEFDTSDFYIVPPAEQYFSDNTFTSTEAFIEAYKTVSEQIASTTLTSKINTINYIRSQFIKKQFDKETFLQLAFNKDLPKFIRTINKLINDIDTELLTSIVNNFNIDLAISNLYNNSNFSPLNLEDVRNGTVNLQNYTGVDVDLEKALNARNQTYSNIIESQLRDFYFNNFEPDTQIGVREYQNDINEFRVVPNSGSVSFNPDENVSTLFNDGLTRTSGEGEELSVVYVEKGIIQFTIPFNAPDRLYYISKNNVDTSGLIRVENIEENTAINVESEILGKKNYTSSNGVEFTNGLKVYFQGDVEPEKYSKGYWYVEGVGDKITLVSDADLKLPASYSSESSVAYDGQGFDSLPFEDIEQYSTGKDYLVINRASVDGNYWSRYNRWFHKSVLEKSFEYNRIPVDIDETGRAKRPIIEFEAGLKLFNFGTKSKGDVDLVDTFTTDVFSTIEGAPGYNVDGVSLVKGMRVLFTADPDIYVNGKIYEVDIIQLGNEKQITLVETDDSEPLENETVLVLSGDENTGKIFHYHKGSWVKAQEKTTLNQAPLFDLCCPLGNEYTDIDVFDSSTFFGTKIFSYKQGDGVADNELGFPLSYRNIENSGDIVFEFNLLTDKFTIQTDSGNITVETRNGNLRKYSDRETFEWVNGWSKEPQQTVQKVLRQYVATDKLKNTFEVDVYDRAGDINDLKTYVYVNGKFKTRLKDYEIDRINSKAFIRFYNDLQKDDIVLIKSTSATPKNENGWYDFPINFERNPLNENMDDYTLGEVIDHVDSMVEDLIDFNGEFPGISNLRDLGNVDRFGKRFVKHTAPMPLSLYHITSKEYNMVKALEYSKNEYSRFKRIFVETASTLGYDGPVKQHFDTVIKEMNRDKLKTQPFYFSDMLGFNETKKIDYVVFDENNPFYALSDVFHLKTLSDNSVNVYLNGSQLLYGRDYGFNEEGFLLLDAGQKEGDVVEVYEYESTNGSFIPSTPTKLGLYPKFEPHISIDDTYQTNTLTNTGPYKIYGEVEPEYQYALSRGWFYPAYTNKRDAEDSDPNGESIRLQFKGLGKFIYFPKSTISAAAQDNPEYEEYSYGVPVIVGHDGSRIVAYKDYRDNLLLELEYRIFNNIKVEYNTEIFDINDFVPGKYRKTEFSRTEINDTILKDFVDWLKLVDADYSENSYYVRENQFTFNYSSMISFADGENLPGFWRAVYKEAYDTDRPHSHPWEMLGYSIKPEWWNEVYGPAPYTSNNLILWEDLEKGIIREPNKPLRSLTKYARPNLTKHIPVDAQGMLLSPIDSNYAKNFFYRNTDRVYEFGDEAPVETAWRRSSEYPFAIIKAWMINQPSKVFGKAFDISRIAKNLAGQYVYNNTQEQISTKTLLFPNTYREDTRILTSGLVNYIYNLVSSDVLKVYDDYRTNLTNLNVQLGIKIGGFSDKNKFKLVLDSRSPKEQENEGIFIPEENYQLFLNSSSLIDFPVYSGVLIEKATDGFIIRGYNDQSPVFRYHPYIQTAKDIRVTVGGISEASTEWRSDVPYLKGQVLENNNEYYRVTKSFTSGSAFTEDNLVKLAELPIVGGRTAIFRRRFDEREILKLPYGTKIKTIQEVIDFILGYDSYLKSIGFDFNYFNNETGYVENWELSAREFLFWTTQGWTNRSTIALSPAANEVSFTREYAIVDNIFDDFYGYSLKQANGLPLEKNFGNIFREKNNFGLSVKDPENGLYNIQLPLIQKEHVVLIDNSTIFNDIVYQPKTGFRQERVRVLGYRSDDWNGGLNIPGFIYDDAKVVEWESWKTYQLGSLVKHKQFYYVAIDPVPGEEEFNPSYWIRLNDRPESELITNFDYRINQFADFYDLDTDNFDSEQQRMAQHLIGYQKRDYLANIITDDVSQYKFYQGFIQDKGTRNALEKLFKPLAKTEQDSLEFYEEWALQLGRYGNTDDVQQVEFVIDENKIKESPQSFELVDQLPVETYDKIYRIRPSDVYDSSEEYISNFLPTIAPKKDFLTGGYVNEDDVQFKASNIFELASGDVNQVDFGNYIWEVFQKDTVWDVKQIINTGASVIQSQLIRQVLPDNRVPVILTLDRWSTGVIEVGDIVGIRGAQLYNLNGLYEVSEARMDKIVILIPSELVETVDNIDTDKLLLVKLRSVKVSDIREANDIVQQDLYNNQKFWIDNYSGENEWAVIENTPVYNETQTILNPSEIDINETQFASVISVTDDNLKLFVGTPYENDQKGKIHYYSKPNSNANLTLTQNIDTGELDEVLDDYNYFGESISVSEDGLYLAVGIPSARNIKTKYKGEFDETVNYSKGDIVKHKEVLWKTVREILATQQNIDYDTFTDFQRLIAGTEDSTSINLLLTGNPGLPNSTTDHILVRAPKNQYVVSEPGDTIKLKWNNITANNLTNGVNYPWGRETLSYLDSSEVISQEHTITYKIDKILTIENILRLPEVGDKIYSDAGAGVVQYVSELDATGTFAIVYINDVSGEFDITGNLFDENDNQIATYSEELTYNLSDLVGGLWYVELDFEYNNEANYFEPGNGLVYVDFRKQDDFDNGELRIINNYYNIKDDAEPSFITHLSYVGNPDKGSFTAQLSDLWLFKVPENYTFKQIDENDEANISNFAPITMEFNNYDDYDFSGTGFTLDVINKTHSIEDIWDGYIDFTITGFVTDSAVGTIGDPYEIEVGDIIEDVQIPRDPLGGLSSQNFTTSQAEVTYVQKIGNSVKIYVRTISGDWEILENVIKTEIRRKANPSKGGTYAVDRIVGEIENENDIVLSKGNYVVTKNDQNFPAEENTPIIGEEYFFYTLESKSYGISFESLTPAEFNRNYVKINQLNPDKFGYDGFENQGAVAIYERQNNVYVLNTVLVSEYSQADRQFGKKIKITKKNNLYTLFVYSPGKIGKDDEGNDIVFVPSSIETFETGYYNDDNYEGIWRSDKTYLKGSIVRYENDYYRALKTVNLTNNILIDNTVWENISWSRKIDNNYVGVWNINNSYNTGDVVIYNNTIYKSLTNIPKNTVFSESEWTTDNVATTVEYSNKIPTTTNIDQVDNYYIKNFDVNKDGSVVVLASNQTAARLTLYNLINKKYDLVNTVVTIGAGTESFADTLSIRPDGLKLAVGEPKNDTIALDQGRVYVYDLSSEESLSEYTTLVSPNNEEAERFGSSLSYSQDNLVITSLRGDMTIPTTFDIDNGINTIFDSGYTQFKNVKIDNGVIYVYEELNDQIMFSESLIYQDTNIDFGEVIVANSNHIYVGMPRKISGNRKGVIVEYKKSKDVFAWKKIREIVPPVDVSKIKGAFLYNKRTNQLLTYIDFIDPVQGKIAGPAEQELTYKVGYDPASYNVNDEQPTSFWSDDHVGELWWNTRTVRFKYPYTGNINYQKEIWNEIQDNFSVNIYEWVESDLLPSQWDTIADSQDAVLAGISGRSLYGDARYSQKYIYDDQSRTFTRKFYFWVEFKRTIPNVENRSLSAFDVASLIARPRQNGYRYLSLLGKNRFVLNNCNSFFYDKDVVLNIKYSTGNKPEQNTHTQYQILTDGLETSLPHPDIERKWFDSLVGFDEQLRPVPDMNLTVKNSYGIQNRPRQSMFVNRFEALKQYFDRVNLVLKENIIVDEYDISELQRFEPMPTDFSRLYDQKVSTYSEIQFVSTNKIIPAVLSPVIDNGKITSVKIVNPGRGYKVSPTYKINGDGEDAEFVAEINDLGQVVDIKIINPGKGYGENTTIVTRRFSVLVENDETVNGKWSIYQWDAALKEWQRSSIQDYDVTTFWDYVDWYQTGYNSNTAPNFIIEGTYDIETVDDIVGDIIKIKNVGTGGWLLLRKDFNFDTEDYTVNYSVIGREKGTIQFKDTLYDVNKNPVGFDSPAFSNTFYDNTPNTELRIIFNAIKNDLFTKNLKIEYNKLFVAALRYVLSEQQNVDWMFKTSFVKVKHNFGELREDITYNNDNLPSYQSYIEEVKPYKTTIREFVSSYNKLENTNSNVTDFDLPPYWDKFKKKIVPSSSTIKNGVIETPESNLTDYPRRNWLENYGHRIKEIKILDSGTGYLSKPTVKIEGGYGEGATAEAFVGYGRITAIKITNPGKNYLKMPTVIIEGPQADNGTPALVSAILDVSAVRTPSVKIKFDRISGRRTAFIKALLQTETFIGTNVNRSFDLEWPMDLRPETITVTVDGKELFSSQFDYQNFENKTAGYTRQQGRISFNTPPALDSEIVVQYQKPISMLDAEDRILYAYKPTDGMIGNDISQLMTGIDYGGVEIQGLDFGKEEGWDTDLWYDDDVWDNTQFTTQDLVFKFDGSTIAIDLEEPLEAGVDYNVYLNNVRIDDPNYGTAEQTNNDAIMTTLTGDGVTSVFDLADLGIVVDETDTLIIRKTTSDGAAIPDPTIYDTALSGGDLAYNSATGLSADDIVVDGDGFVTATTSGGPEELVPGQVMDTLDIQVYSRKTGGTGVIHSQNYIMDPSTKVYDLDIIPANNNSVIVKVDNRILGNDEYSINWEDNTVTIDSPQDSVELSIVATSLSATQILDYGNFVIDGSTTSYEMDFDYNEDVSVYVTVAGETADVRLTETVNGKFGIEFVEPQDEGALVNYTLILGNDVVNYSQISKEVFVVENNNTSEFVLREAPFYSQPLAHNIIVKIGNKILDAGYNIKYVIPQTRQREFKIEKFQYTLDTLLQNRLRVYLNSVEITSPNQWYYDIGNSSIILAAGVGNPGDVLRIVVFDDGEYQLNDNVLTLSEPLDIGNTVEVLKFSNHDVVGFERISYDVVNRDVLQPGEQEYITYHRLTFGEIKLRSFAESSQYVWVILNGELLTPEVDYYLTEDGTRVRLTSSPKTEDVYQVIQFTTAVMRPEYAYRQFKDILNRTHFKRIDKPATVLAKNLNWFDSRIEVVDASNLPEPNPAGNRPGIVFIGKERIEYFVKDGNLLRQLRRGTLGTGIKETYTAGTDVHDQSAEKTIPYMDRTETQTIIADGTTNTFDLKFDAESKNEFEVFVSGYRLNKNDIKVFDPELGLDSPVGDIDVDTDFEFDKETKQITLKTTPLENQKIMIIRKIGREWKEKTIIRFLENGDN